MLDFSQVATQIRAFAGEHARLQPLKRAAQAEARARLRDSGGLWEETREKIADSRTSWLVADWREAPDLTFAAPERPFPHLVFAADGSQIVSDRHDIALCYLINVGRIVLRYGTGERATLTSVPSLAAPDDDLLDEFQTEQAVIAPRRLALRRQIAEIAALAAMIEEGGEAKQTLLPALALVDGSLILWTLEPENERFRRETLAAFEQHLETARKHQVPVAGYISQPQSRDVLNALRVFRCPHPLANCDRYCPKRVRPKPDYVAPDCAGTERITDAELFENLLRPGERSAVFASRSQILASYPEPSRVCFFYLHVGAEVARVEVPQWVADDAGLLAQTHALCWDQAQKGGGVSGRAGGSP